jgi:hypothetical protein
MSAEDDEADGAAEAAAVGEDSEEEVEDGNSSIAGALLPPS